MSILCPLLHALTGNVRNFVDVLVLVRDASWDARMWVRGLLEVVAREMEMETVGWRFSIHVHTPAWLAQRRAIEAFFIAEVDRDKIAV